MAFTVSWVFFLGLSTISSPIYNAPPPFFFFKLYLMTSPPNRNHSSFSSPPFRLTPVQKCPFWDRAGAFPPPALSLFFPCPHGSCCRPFPSQADPSPPPQSLSFFCSFPKPLFSAGGVVGSFAEAVERTAFYGKCPVSFFSVCFSRASVLFFFNAFEEAQVGFFSFLLKGTGRFFPPRVALVKNFWSSCLSFRQLTPEPLRTAFSSTRWNIYFPFALFSTFSFLGGKSRPLSQYRHSRQNFSLSSSATTDPFSLPWINSIGVGTSSFFFFFFPGEFPNLFSFGRIGVPLFSLRFFFRRLTTPQAWVDGFFLLRGRFRKFLFSFLFLLFCFLRKRGFFRNSRLFPLMHRTPLVFSFFFKLNNRFPLNEFFPLFPTRIPNSPLLPHQGPPHIFVKKFTPLFRRSFCRYFFSYFPSLASLFPSFRVCYRRPHGPPWFSRQARLSSLYNAFVTKIPPFFFLLFL